ncbi:hypothetical protein, partial [Klebsiella pneumoniae]|uniref:hypothetical protein n=1 Tax=Klebsiella pneumoniae TaxID=573 RepID=UPI0028800CD0
ILRGVRQQQDEPGRFSICSRQAAVVQGQLEAWQDLNPDLNLYMYQTRATTNPVLRGKERAEFLEYLKDFPTLPPLNAINCERKIYRDVVPLGKSVLEATNRTAIEEVEQLIEEVYSKWL